MKDAAGKNAAGNRKVAADVAKGVQAKGGRDKVGRVELAGVAAT